MTKPGHNSTKDFSKNLNTQCEQERNTHLLDEVEDVVETHVGHVEHVLIRRHSSQDTSPPSLLLRSPGGAGSIDRAPSSSCGPKANQSSSSCVSDGHGGHYLQQLREGEQAHRQTTIAAQRRNEEGEGEDDGPGMAFEEPG